MITIQHKADSNRTETIPRNSWELNNKYSISNWIVIDEGDPVILYSTDIYGNIKLITGIIDRDRAEITRNSKPKAYLIKEIEEDPTVKFKIPVNWNNAKRNSPKAVVLNLQHKKSTNHLDELEKDSPDIIETTSNYVIESRKQNYSVDHWITERATSDEDQEKITMNDFKYLIDVLNTGDIREKRKLKRFITEGKFRFYVTGSKPKPTRTMWSLPKISFGLWDVKFSLWLIPLSVFLFAGGFYLRSQYQIVSNISIPERGLWLTAILFASGAAWKIRDTIAKK